MFKKKEKEEKGNQIMKDKLEKIIGAKKRNKMEGLSKLRKKKVG